MRSYPTATDLRPREHGSLANHPGFSFRVHGHRRDVVRLYDDKRNAAEVGEAVRAEHGWNGMVRLPDGGKETLMSLEGANEHGTEREFGHIAAAVKAIISRYSNAIERVEREENEILTWIGEQKTADER